MAIVRQATFTDKSGYTQAHYLENKNSILVSMSDTECAMQYSTFMSTDYQPDGFDTGLKSFLGVAGNQHDPLNVRRGACSNSVVSCEPTVGVMEKEFTLAAGESIEFNLIIGIAQHESDIDVYRDTYFQQKKINDSFQHVSDYYQQKLSQMQIKTPNPAFDRYCNIWLKNSVFHSLKWTRGLGSGLP